MSSGYKYGTLEDIEKELSNLKEMKKRLVKERRKKYARTGDTKYDKMSSSEQAITKQVNRLRSAKTYRLNKKMSKSTSKNE